MKNPLTAALVKRFKVTYKGTPTWPAPFEAWDFPPTVPLIGNNYEPGKGLLIYASAENLSWLNNETPPPRFSDKNAWNRYRIRYEEQGRNSTDFFPDVGIQPVTDGGLFAAGLFLSQKAKLPVRLKPRTFLEQIAVSNWCKFTIKAHTDRDYISDIKKLTASLPFVIGELALLQPKAVLIPKQPWHHNIIRAAMRGASPNTRFIPVPQFNSRVVNTHLKKHDRPAATLRRKHKGTPLARWMDQLSCINKNHAWRYLAMLESTS